MADVVQRRESKNRFGWFTGKDKAVPAQNKLSKAPSRRGAVSGPRKMGQPPYSSTDQLDLKDVPPPSPMAETAVPSMLSAKASALTLEKRWEGSGAGNVVKRESSINEYAFSRPPAWAVKSGEWSSISVPEQPRFSIHEPTGPTWYINHHLRPPPTARPRTSFPPSPFTSQTASGSSSPPTSKVNKPPRQYNDHVDSLDVSDPHGTRWHHASPYELPRATATRPRSQFVGPGVGTFAGPIEGSEPVEATYAAFVNSASVTPPPSGGRVTKSRSSSHTRIVAPSPLSQSHSADDLGTHAHRSSSVIPGLPISLDDPLPIPAASFITNSSTSSLLTMQPNLQDRSESPLKQSAPSSPTHNASSSIPRKPAPSPEPDPNLSIEQSESLPANNESDAQQDLTLPIVGSYSTEGARHPKPFIPPVEATPPSHSRKRSVSASAAPSRDGSSGGFFRMRRASNQNAPAASIPPLQSVPTSISAPTSLKPPTTKPPTTLNLLSRNGSTSALPTEKREKRGSMLNRLVKKFSTSRKPDPLAGRPYLPESARNSPTIPEDDGPLPSETALESATASAPATMSSLPVALATGGAIDSKRSTSAIAIPPTLEALVQKEMQIAQASDIRHDFDDLPPHIPTPRAFSPLMLTSSIPPGSPRPEDASFRIGSLMIANPDMIPSRSPSPPSPSLPAPSRNSMSSPLPNPPKSPPLPELPRITSPEVITSPLPLRALSIVNVAALERDKSLREQRDSRMSFERQWTVPQMPAREPPPFTVLSASAPVPNNAPIPPVITDSRVQESKRERERTIEDAVPLEPPTRPSVEHSHRESRSSIDRPRDRRESTSRVSTRPPSSGAVPPTLPLTLPPRESVSLSTSSFQVPNGSTAGHTESSSREKDKERRKHTSSSPTKPSRSSRDDGARRDGDRDKDRIRSSPTDSGRPAESERERERRKHKERDRDRDRSGDRHRDRDRDRDGEHRHRKDRDHDRDRDRDRDRDHDRDRRRRSEDRQRSGDSPTKSSRPQPSEHHHERRHRSDRTEISGDVTPPLTIQRPADRRSSELSSSRGGTSSGLPQSSPVVPSSRASSPQKSRSSPTKVRRTSTETISALGKEWEIVPDDSVSQRHVSRSRERKQSSSKRDTVLTPSASGSLANGIVQKSKSIVRMRRSLSADSSLTSKSRNAPTPPPKANSTTKPPTSGSHPLPTRRRSTTPPPRGTSPSPQPSRPVISGPSPIGSSRSRKNSTSSINLRSSSSRPQINTQSTQPTQPLKTSSSNRPIRPSPPSESHSSSGHRSRQPKSVSTDDLPTTLRRVDGREINPNQSSNGDRSRKRGQSWSTADPPEIQQHPPPPVPYQPTTSTRSQDGYANGDVGYSAQRAPETDLGIRVGSSHTSFSMQAPIGSYPVGRTQQPSSTPLASQPGVIASDFYGRAVQQYHQATTPIQSPYASPQTSSLAGYDLASQLSGSPYSVQSNMLPAGYPASSSLTNISQSAPPLSSSPLSDNATYVQFSNRAPYPIASYGQRESTAWSSYSRS